jgi:Tfp pilus assembly protein PilF
MQYNQKQNMRSSSRLEIEAVKFYSDKLAGNPEMPRYNHLMAAISSEKGQADIAEKYYRQALT